MGLYDLNGLLLLMNDYFVKPDTSMYINPCVSNNTGIDFGVFNKQRNAMHNNEVLTMCSSYVTYCQTLVAHNMAYASNTLSTEFERNGFTTLTTNTLCTMPTTKTAL